jgi:uncharacterized membrane protein
MDRDEKQILISLTVGILSTFIYAAVFFKLCPLSHQPLFMNVFVYVMIPIIAIIGGIATLKGTWILLNKKTEKKITKKPAS